MGESIGHGRKSREWGVGSPIVPPKGGLWGERLYVSVRGEGGSAPGAGVVKGEPPLIRPDPVPHRCSSRTSMATCRGGRPASFGKPCRSPLTWPITVMGRPDLRWEGSTRWEKIRRKGRAPGSGFSGRKPESRGRGPRGHRPGPTGLPQGRG